VDGNLKSMRGRLATIEAFLDANPVWHGSQFVIAERSGLRIDIERLELEETLKVEASGAQLREQIESANLLHARARSKVEVGEFEAALAALKSAREIAPADWEGLQKIESDIQAVAQHLKENQ